MEKDNRESAHHHMGSSSRHSYPVGSSYRKKEVNTTAEYVDYEDDEDEQYMDCPFEQMDPRQNKTPRITTNREQYEEMLDAQNNGDN